MAVTPLAFFFRLPTLWPTLRPSTLTPLFVFVENRGKLFPLFQVWFSYRLWYSYLYNLMSLPIVFTPTLWAAKLLPRAFWSKFARAVRASGIRLAGQNAPCCNRLRYRACHRALAC